MTNEPTCFEKPGLISYLILQSPFNSNSAAPCPKGTDEAIVKIWKMQRMSLRSTDECKYFSDLPFPPADHLNEEWILKDRIQSSPHGILFAKSELLFDSNGNQPQNAIHETVLEYIHDSVVFRTMDCNNESNSDLTQVAARLSELRVIYSSVPDPIGSVYVVYFNVSSAEEGKHESQLLAFAKAFCKLSGIVVLISESMYYRGGSCLLCRLEVASFGKGIGYEQIWFAAIEQDQPFNRATFYNDTLTPRFLNYAVVNRKLRTYSSQTALCSVEADRLSRAFEAKLDEVNNLIVGNDADAIDDPGAINNASAKLNSLLKERKAFENTVAKLHRWSEQVRLNKWTFDKLSDSMFGSTSAEFSTIAIDDRFTAERDWIECSGKIRMTEILQNSHQTQLQILESQIRMRDQMLRDRDNESKEEFDKRIHLLELFVISVYVIELIHLFHQLGFGAFSVALLAVITTAVYIFGFRLRAGRSHHKIESHTSLRQRVVRGVQIPTPVLMCLLLVMIALAGSVTFPSKERPTWWRSNWWLDFEHGTEQVAPKPGEPNTSTQETLKH